MQAMEPHRHYDAVPRRFQHVFWYVNFANNATDGGAASDPSNIEK